MNLELFNSVDMFTSHIYLIYINKPDSNNHDALKQSGLNKLPGLDGLPYKVYLRLPHMFVPILMDMFNHWFPQGAIQGSITKGVITLLKKSGRHVWEGLDDYRPISLLNTELKILAQVLANRLQVVISNMISPEQTYAVKGSSIQENLRLVHEVLEGIEDGTEATQSASISWKGGWEGNQKGNFSLFFLGGGSSHPQHINLDQFKAFYRVDHRFLASVWETAEFKLEFRRWINMMYHNPQAVVQVNEMCSRSSNQSSRAAPCLFSMSSIYRSCSKGLGMRRQIRPCMVSL